jgi:hypothetical protein
MSCLLPAPASASPTQVTWRVSAQQDGTLQCHRAGPLQPPVASLFWEADRSACANAELLPEGAQDTFCVPGREAGEWLLEALARWGLSPREYTECASFWAPRMQAHAWVQIRLLPAAQWEALAPLSIDPPMQHTLRLFLVWRGRLEYSAELDAGVLPERPPPREGSWCVEWGGSELEDA